MDKGIRHTELSSISKVFLQYYTHIFEHQVPLTKILSVDDIFKSHISPYLINLLYFN